MHYFQIEEYSHHLGHHEVPQQIKSPAFLFEWFRSGLLGWYAFVELAFGCQLSVLSLRRLETCLITSV